MLIGLTTTTWAAIGAIAASAAALTALITVLQNTWLQRAMLQPHLTGIVVLAAQLAGLEIHNAGGGVAITPRFFWAHEGRFVEGELSGGIAPGEYRDVLADDLNRDTLADSHGVLICKDVRDNWYAWSLDGHADVWRNRLWKRRPQRPIASALYEKYYGRGSLGGAERTTWHLGRRVSEAVIFEPQGPPQVQ
jgi:hypothetical protein